VCQIKNPIGLRFHLKIKNSICTRRPSFVPRNPVPKSVLEPVTLSYQIGRIKNPNSVVFSRKGK
jgi:hypothetical protein